MSPRTPKPRSRAARLIPLGMGAAGLLLAPADAPAQSKEFVLDDSREWVEVEPRTETESDERIDRARELLALDKPGEAHALVSRWIEEHDGTSHPRLPEAFLLRADALVAQNNEFKALYDYEAVIRRFPQSEAFRTAVERELEIGLKYIDGYRRKLWGMRIADATEIGVEILIRVQERMPNSALAERAAIELADHYYERREMELARDAYDLYVMNFPNGPNRMKAEMRRIYAEVARFKGPRYDASGLLNARVKIENFAARYPAEAANRGLNSAMIARIDESMAAQLLETAKWYLDLNDGASARYTLERLVRAYPETFAAQNALAIMDRRGWSSPEPEGSPTTGAPTSKEAGSVADATDSEGETRP